MRREIGSEFWDVPIAEKNNGLFPKNTQWYLSGRIALKAIIKDLGEARSVSLPSWSCESMVKPFFDAHYTIKYYSVLAEDITGNKQPIDTDVLLLMDYFGYTTPTPDFKANKGILIRDTTQSLFSSSYNDADYYFGSLRKWCGVWTGGYAWKNDGHLLETGTPDKGDYLELRRQAMEEKQSYIERQYGNKDYLKLFEAAESCLDTVGIAPAADRDVYLARHLDIELINKQRRTNAEILIKAFPTWLIFPKLSNADTPMFVPVLIPGGKRDELRRFLIQNDIYCPIHWPMSEFNMAEEKTALICQNELSLVCDQRYTVEDMYRMVKTIKKFMGE